MRDNHDPTPMKLERTYESSLAALAALAPRGWRLGLDRMQAFVVRAGLQDALGRPPGPKYIQVAGTNGKGTTTAFLQSLLVAQGHHTGAGYSPFVYDPRERVQVGTEPIAKEDWARRTFELLDRAEGMDATELGGPTEFELKIALGLKTWLEEGCDWVALEVGLGGRLDATSVVHPECGVIVSIGLDHMAILGDTLEQIAAEKAGILKPGMPLILGEMDVAPRDVIRGIAAEKGSEVWEYGQDIRWDGHTLVVPGHSFEDLKPTLQGAKVRHNLALAVAALVRSGAMRDPERIAEGIAKAWLPGRFERRTVHGVPMILDGAHNEPSAQVLAASLREAGYQGLTLLTGMLNGHEPREFYAPLWPLIKRVHIAPIDFFRARHVDELAAELHEALVHAERGPQRIVAHARLEQALNAALAHGDPVLVTGSFYLLGDVGQALANL